MLLDLLVLTAHMPETNRSRATVTAWWMPSKSSSSPAAPTPAPRPRTRASSRSSAPAAATATRPATALVSCSPAPPGRQREPPSQRDRSPGTAESRLSRRAPQGIVAVVGDESDRLALRGVTSDSSSSAPLPLRSSPPSGPRSVRAGRTSVQDWPGRRPGHRRGAFRRGAARAQPSCPLHEEAAPLARGRPSMARSGRPVAWGRPRLVVVTSSPVTRRRQSACRSRTERT